MKENKQMTEQELDDVTAGAELSDEELDGVAGGALSVYTNVASYKGGGGGGGRIECKVPPGASVRRIGFIVGPVD